jgi:hypothetical protein
MRHRVLPQKHRWLDQWLVPRSGTPLQVLADAVKEDVARYETEQGTRTRKRKAIDQEHHDAAIALTVANLAYMVLNPSETGRLALNIRRLRFEKTRYENAAIGATFRKYIDASLEALGMLVFEFPKTKGFRGEASSIVPTEAFADRVLQSGISFSHFTRDDHEEVILLDRVEYTDTAITNSYRDTLRGLNAFLASSDIASWTTGAHLALTLSSARCAGTSSSTMGNLHSIRAGVYLVASGKT